MTANRNLTLGAPLPVLTDREAKFAEYMAMFDNPADAWVASGPVGAKTKRQSMQRVAYDMLARPAVRARIIQLRNAMAEQGAQSTRAALVSELEAACEVDTREIVDLRVGHCPSCYSSPAFAAARAQDAALPSPLAVDVFDPKREPWEACAACRGAGVITTHFTPFDKLSAPARRLLRGVERYGDGSIKRVLIADQSALRMELHKVVPNFYAPTVNVNLNADVKPLTGLSVDEALAIMESVAPTLPAPPDPTVVSQQ
jgi:hypothetical protein